MQQKVRVVHLGHRSTVLEPYRRGPLIAPRRGARRGPARRPPRAGGTASPPGAPGRGRLAALAAAVRRLFAVRMLYFEYVR